MAAQMGPNSPPIAPQLGSQRELRAGSGLSSGGGALACGILLERFGEHWAPRWPLWVFIALNWEVTKRWFATRRSEAAESAPSVVDTTRSHSNTQLRSLSPGKRPHALVSHGKSICIASGKGGTGKSMITASLASLLSGRAPTLLVDADLGVGNAHIMQGVSPRHTVADVLAGKVCMREALQSCGPDLDLLAGGSGLAHLSNLKTEEIDLLSSELRQVEPLYRYLLVDSGAGLSRQTLAFAGASDLVLLVTTPAVTALTDAYAFLKVLSSRCPQARVALVLNRVQSEAQGLEASQRLQSVAKRFLDKDLPCLAHLPEHPSAFEATQERRPLVQGGEGSALTAGLIQLERTVVKELSACEGKGFGEQLGQHIFA